MTLRSIRAVLAGFVAVAVVSTIADVVLHAIKVYPPWGEPIGDGLSLLATAYRVAITIAGGYLTARLAPARPLAHAVALGVVGVVVASAGAAATWNVQPPLGPHWYPLALAATALPCTWIGGSLWRERANAAAPDAVGHGAY
jgi:hypothetical protein